MKKFYCFILSILLMFSIIGANPVMAQEQSVNKGICGVSATWEYDAETKVLTVSGSGTVTGLQAFDANNQIEKIVIKSGIETIGQRAFVGYNCREIVLEEGLKKIENYAFYGFSKLKEITIPKSVTTLEASPFEETSLKKVMVLGDVKVDNIPFGYACFVETLEIAGKFENLASIAASVDARMPKVVLINNNPNYCIENGLIMSADKKILYAMNGDAQIKDLVIPDSIETIMPYAFYMRNSFDTVKLGKNLKSIGEYAFSKCDINKLVIPTNVTTIGERAFADCFITTVKFNKKIKSIGESAFESNDLKKVRLYNYPKIEKDAFDKDVAIEYYGEKKVSKAKVKISINQGTGKYKITLGKRTKTNVKYKITIRYGSKKTTKTISPAKKKSKSVSIKMKKKAFDKKHKVYVKVKAKGKWGKKVRIL